MKYWVSIFAMAVLILTGCSSSSASNAASSASSSSSVHGSSTGNASQTQDNTGNTSTKATTASLSSLETAIQTRKMVIYNAELTIEVQHFSAVQSQIEQLASSSGGYILNSTISDTDQTKQAGTLTLRIPNQQFEIFLNDVAKISTKVVSRKVTGEDVTDQYVDLESSLKAKQQVADRLTSFMQSAKTTEDLLKISNNLAQVQQDIETIKGRMKYFEVNSALSKVTIQISESSTAVASLSKENPGVWGKTKSLFVGNVNWLAGVLSSIFIFLIGASPTILILAAIGWLIYTIRRRYLGRTRNAEGREHEKL